MLLVLGQALLQVLGESVGTHIAQYVDMAVVAVLQALQGAVLLRLVEELVDLVEQAVVFTGRHRPALVAGVAQVEGNPHVGEVHLVHRQLVGVDQGQVDLAFIDHAQQVDHLDGVGFLVFQARVLLFQLGQLVGMAAALEHHDLLSDQALGVGGARATVAVDDLWGHFQIRVGVPDLGLAPFAGDQAGRCQHRAGGLAEAVIQLVEVVGGLDLQLHAQIFGEMLDQLVFEAGFAVAVLEVGGRAVAGDHAQHAILLHALEGAGVFQRRHRAAERVRLRKAIWRNAGAKQCGRT
ncbi:hypothetical protein PPS11_16231 [Pseudomonas putida S11]|nr:hypothetical protein PPS11_16231 [Pseudomonas putida S11]